METKKINIVAIIIVVVVLISIAFLLFGNRDGSLGVAEEEAVQDDGPRKASIFELPNYDGETVSLRDYKGKIVVVNAWASWCPFCVNELPDFAQLQDAFPNEVAVVAINRAEPPATAKSYSDSLGLSTEYTFLIDSDDTFYKSIGGFTMPETIFVKPNGEIALHKRGPMKFEEMKVIIENLLSE